MTFDYIDGGISVKWGTLKRCWKGPGKTPQHERDEVNFGTSFLKKSLYIFGHKRHV